MVKLLCAAYTFKKLSVLFVPTFYIVTRFFNFTLYTYSTEFVPKFCKSQSDTVIHCCLLHPATHHSLFILRKKTISDFFSHFYFRSNQIDTPIPHIAQICPSAVRLANLRKLAQSNGEAEPCQSHISQPSHHEAEEEMRLNAY